MTFGGGVAGIGFDVSGLGEEGVSLISAYECNEQGGCQDQYLGRQEDGSRAEANAGYAWQRTGLSDPVISKMVALVAGLRIRWAAGSACVQAVGMGAVGAGVRTT